MPDPEKILPGRPVPSDGCSSRPEDSTLTGAAQPSGEGLGLPLDRHFTPDFLSDTAPVTTPERLVEVCLALRLRSQGLRALTVRQRIDALAQWTARWLEPDYPFRMEAVKRLEQSSGFSKPVLAWALDALFAAWDRPALEALVEEELGSGEVLERFAHRPGSSVGRRAIPPRLLACVLSGNVPAPALQSLVAGLLVGAPVFMKASSSDPWFPTLLVRSLEADAPLFQGAAGCAVWPGGSLELEASLFGHAEVVVAYGSQETLRSIQSRLPSSVRFVARGHRVSIAYLAREALERNRAVELAKALATDVAIYDQQGCLSPHLVLVETGGELEPEAFLELMLDVAPTIQGALPVGRIDPEQAARAMQLKGVYAFTGDVREAGGFTVVLTSERTFSPSCLGRVLLVRPIAGLEDALDYLEPVAAHLQGVALAAVEPRRTWIAERLAGLGAGRICPPGALQRPPAAWGGDGRPVLGDLVRWASLE